MKKVLYEGKTGSGKTNKIKDRVKELILDNKSMVILDTKKEYQELFNGTNYEIIKLDITDLDNMSPFNPLKIAEVLFNEGNIDKAIDKIASLGDLLFITEGNIDPFWDNSAKSLFVGICLYILEQNRKLNIKEVIKVAINELDELTNYINKQDVLSTISVITSNIINSPQETKGGIISVFTQKISLLAQRPNLFDKITTNDVLELKPSNQVIIITNFDRENIYNTIIEYAIVNIINEVIDKKTEYSVIIDNFDTIINKDIFNQLFNTYLSDNIECIIGVRNRDLIESVEDFES